MLNAAVIGLGVGEQHIAGYERHSDCRVTALCDIDPAKGREVQGRHPGKSLTTDPDEILRDPTIDVVSIASYDQCHAEQILTALEYGKHVFVEKPLCLTRDEAVDIRTALSGKPELRLSSNLILRCCPRFCQLRDRVSSGAMGDIFAMEGDYLYGRIHKIVSGWRSETDGYSVILGGGVHMVDLLIWLKGKKVVEVSGAGNRVAAAGTSFRYNDFATAILRFEDDTIARVSSNYGCVYPHYHAVKIFGTEATFINQKDSGLYCWSRDPDDGMEVSGEAYPGTHKGDHLHGFIDGILRQGVPGVDTEDVFSTMSVCLAIDEAIRTKTLVEVDYI